MYNEAITAEIIPDLMVLKDTSEISSEHVLVWAHRVGSTKVTENSIGKDKTQMTDLGEGIGRDQARMVIDSRGKV